MKTALLVTDLKGKNIDQEARKLLIIPSQIQKYWSAVTTQTARFTYSLPLRLRLSYFTKGRGNKFQENSTFFETSPHALQWTLKAQLLRPPETRIQIRWERELESNNFFNHFYIE